MVPEGFIIGRADYGIRGYTPIRVGGFDFKTWDDAKKFADEQNQSIGLTKEQAMEIVRTSKSGWAAAHPARFSRPVVRYPRRPC